MVGVAGAELLEPELIGLPANEVESADAVEETPTEPQATIRLEKKHPRAIRWMHWVNFPVLSVMIWSGLLIYWNRSDNTYRPSPCGVSDGDWIDDSSAAVSNVVLEGD